MIAHHLKPLSLSYLNILDYYEQVYISKPGDPNFSAEEVIYQNWIGWVENVSERETILGTRTKRSKSLIFDSYDDKYATSYLLNIQELTVAQLQACPEKFKEMIDETIKQNIRYLIVIIP